jgi:hypothetical protein
MIKACSLAGFLILCLSGSLFADSVSSSDVVAAFKATSNDIAKNLKAYQSNQVLQSQFQDGQKAYSAGLVAQLFGFTSQAQADFKIAISDFSQVSNGLSTKVPDAGSLSLLGCAGLMLCGALKRKFSR